MRDNLAALLVISSQINARGNFGIFNKESTLGWRWLVESNWKLAIVVCSSSYSIFFLVVRNLLNKFVECTYGISTDKPQVTNVNISRKSDRDSE